MSFIPKVGLIACSGEECTGGNVSRMAALKVLHKLKPHDTITICLPLFLAGDSGERGFAEVFPTITIDGCGKLCAARSTAKYSSEPAVKINVEDYMGPRCRGKEEQWRVNDGSAIVDKIAEDVAKHVEELRDALRDN